MRADSVDGVLINHARGRGDMIHSKGGRNTALENLTSTEGKGERILGSVMNKMSSDVSRQMLQKGSS